MISLIGNDIEFCFGSDLGLLDLVQSFSDHLTKLSGFDSDAQYWIGLAVREAVTNAIQHGNSGDPQRRVGLLFRVNPDKLEIVVRDEGKGIDETSIPDPLNPENLLKPGGRGIFFVRSFMDAVTFRVRPEGGHEMIMEKFRSQDNQGDDNDN